MTQPTLNSADGVITNFHMIPNPAYGCPQVSDCYAANCFSQPGPNYTSFTGVTSQSWFAPACPSISSIAGGDFVSFSSDGIGLWTYSGNSLNDDFIVKSSARSDREEIYVTFLTGNAATVMKPFGADPSCYASPSSTHCKDDVRMRVSSSQAAPALYTSGDTQVQQKMALLLKNNAGKAIAITPYTICKGLNCATNLQARTVPTNFDLTNGTPFIGGPIGSVGQATTLNTPWTTSGTSTAWTSCGTSGTQNTAFSNRREFCYEITWGQFVKILRNIAHLKGENPNSYSGVAAIFGSAWGVQDAWNLHVVHFAQEIANDDWAQDTAYIGGNLGWYEIEALD